MFRVLTILFLILSLISGLFVTAQNEIGNPYIKNFNSKKHKFTATVWDITQDKKGLMYFGVSAGVRRFDGTNWLSIAVDNESTVRALDVDENGRVYVGAKDEFGYLDEDSLGYPIYVSLSKKLEKKYQDFSDVWNVYVTKQGIFFYSFSRIFRWHNNEFTIYEYDDITAHLGFCVNENIYLVRLKTGLHYFKNNDFVLVPGGSHFIGQTIFSVLPFDDHNVVVATRKEGLVLHNIRTGETRAFDNEVNEQLMKDRIYHGAMSAKGEYIIGTLNNGIYVVNKAGKLINHISQKNGLQSNNIKYIFKDKVGAIWLGNAMGLSYVDLSLPLTFFDKESGISGNIRDVIRFENTIYIATGNGIYYLDKEENRFTQIEKADNQFWCFLKVNDKLLVGTDGLQELKNKQLKKIESFGGNAVFSILRSEVNPNLIYLALKSGVAVVEVSPTGDIKSIHKLKGYDVESHFLAEDAHGNLWVSTAFNYMVKIDKRSFNKEEDFPISYREYHYDEKLAQEQVIKLKNKVLFTSSKGLLKNIGETFEATNLIKIDGKPEVFKIRELTETKDGNLWVHYHNKEESGVFLAIKNADNTYQFKANPFTRINEKINHVKAPYVDDSGIVWFFGGEEIVRYDPSKEQKNKNEYSVNISKVSLKFDSIISYGMGINISENIQIAYKNNALTFTFSAATYSNEDEVYYQYFLEGQDEKWSDWTSLNSKEYNFLHEGDYRFKVRAKNVYNQLSKEETFVFTILPPWYRETWAYIFYLFAFLGLILLVIKIATYRLNNAKKQLELIVKERTKDIVIEKEKVEQQKLELEDIHSELSERNKDVMDSIKYAQRIQSSILPPVEKLTSEFPESFVFYKPRDIVSGDFYWYQKVGDFFIIACADCTGHGVPGAFMSMIGTTLLNKIVEQDNVARCEDALAELDVELQKTLQQKDGESENKIVMDGMDISLIAVNLKTKECHYSGAHRPLYLLRNKEVVVFDSNRMSIGGGFIKDKKFKGESIKIVSGDQLYMFTDGIVDQFGGQKNKKFKRERLKKLLLEICDLNMARQSKEIHAAFENWMGENEQIDDVLIMGVKIP